MTRRAVGHLIRRELAHFRIDQRQQLIGGLRIAMLDLPKNARHIAQRGTITKFRGAATENKILRLRLLPVRFVRFIKLQARFAILLFLLAL
jgi:hypothetical protein